MESLAELFVSAQNLSQSCIAIQLAGGEDGKVQTGIPDNTGLKNEKDSVQIMHATASASRMPMFLD